MTHDDLPDYWHRFWQLYAESFVTPLKSNALLSEFVANPNVTGLYAEAWIRSLVRSMLPQFRISTGAVIRPSDTEIKRSCSGTADVVRQLQERKKLLRLRCRKNRLGVVIEHNTPLFAGEVKPDWLEDSRWIKECPLVCLLTEDVKPHTNDIMALIYFLAQVAGQAEIVS